MAYKRVQKSFGQSSSQKKQFPIVPPLNEQQTQSDSPSSSKAMSRLPSSEERGAIRRSLFEKWANAPQSSSVAGTSIQAKLTIGEPGDKYEQEADRVAAQVVNRINAPSSTEESVQREAMPEEEELQMKPLADSIQRVEIDDEEELQMKTQVQRREAIGGGEASTDLESSINSARGGGQSLDAGLQESIGQAMGADFSGVRVHTDAQADQLNQSIQARAFTTGQDVFFRQGEYNPGSRGGQELIAHELTHVVQQKGEAVGVSCETRSAHCSQGTFATNEMEEKGVARVAQGTDQVEYSAMPQSDGLVQRAVVEAGATPVKQEKKEGGDPSGVRISGLINCVGVVAKIVGPQPAFKITHVVGGHFVSPEMYDFNNNCFFPAGEEFINRFNEHISGHYCEMEYHVAAAAVEGSTEPRSLLEAKQAAEALKVRLGKGPTVVGQSAFEVII